MNVNARLAGLIFAVLAIPGAGGSAAHPRRIEIVASRFSFSPAEITLKKGETVTLVLRSTDVTHGLKVPELGIKTDIRKGRETDVTITPAEVGQFAGKCAHFCGDGHGSMTLQIDVVE